MKYFLIFLLMFVASQAHAQTALPTTPGYLSISGCPGSITPCFIPYSAANPLPISVSTSSISGVLPVANGGTGATALGPTITNANSTLNTTQPNRTVTITTDSITSSDVGNVVQYNSASPVAVSIASASTSGLTSGFGFSLTNIGTATATLTPSGSTINGAASLAITANTGCYIYSDGTNYQVDLSACSAITGGLSAINSHYLVANTTSGSAIPVGTSLSAEIDAAINNTQGAILYRGASLWTNLPIGTSTYVLTSNGTAPGWSASTTGAGTVSTGTSGNIAYYNATGTTVIGTSAISINTSTWNVGIGTASPRGTLDVNGTVAASGNGSDINLWAQNGASGSNGGNINLKAGTSASNGRGVINILGYGTGNGGNVVQFGTNGGHGYMNIYNSNQTQEFLFYANGPGYMNAAMEIGGTGTPLSKLDVNGNIAVGAGYATVTAAPTNGLIVQGTTGIGTATPASELSVYGGGLAVGTYAATANVGIGSAVFSGNVGIGTANPVTGSVITLAGHQGFYQSAVPTVTSCGGGTAVAGSTDNKGQITGISAATACTLTFGSAMPPSPSCFATGSVAIVNPSLSAISTSAVTFAMTAFTGTIYYVCM